MTRSRPAFDVPVKMSRSWSVLPLSYRSYTWHWL